MRFSGALATLALTLLAGALFVASTACGDDGGDDADGDATAAESPGQETPAETGGATPSGPTSTSGPTTDMSAILTNTPFSITLSQDTAPAGRVNIAVTNEGTVGHNFWVIRTDLPPAGLPVVNNVVDVGSLDVVTNSGIVTNDEDIEPGDQLGVLLPELEPGAYVVICNVPDHYSAGMQASLTIE